MYFKISFPSYKEEFYIVADSAQDSLDYANQLMEDKITKQLRSQISDDKIFAEQLLFALDRIHVKFIEEIFFRHVCTKEPFENE